MGRPAAGSAPRCSASLLAPDWPRLAAGERFEYSNLGYAIVGLAIEAVTHLPYAEAAAMRVLRPVGMAATGYHLDALDEVVEHMASSVAPPDGRRSRGPGTARSPPWAACSARSPTSPDGSA